MLLRRLGRREEAEREFRRAIGLAGGLAEARKELAELLEGTDLVTAIREWEEFLRLAEVQPRFAGILEAARRHVDELRTKLAAERNSGT
ncbi:MAG: hypothetical protein HYZ53_04870 [Planctomycetes bacterium]|nr:hypothetical protein [Planctomycetota bacterium]